MRWLRLKYLGLRQHYRVQRRWLSPPALPRFCARLHALGALDVDHRVGVAWYGHGRRSVTPLAAGA